MPSWPQNPFCIAFADLLGASAYTMHPTEVGQAAATATPAPAHMQRAVDMPSTGNAALRKSAVSSQLATALLSISLCSPCHSSSMSVLVRSGSSTPCLCGEVTVCSRCHVWCTDCWRDGTLCNNAPNNSLFGRRTAYFIGAIVPL